jgi:hypothetical protein
MESMATINQPPAKGEKSSALRCVTANGKPGKIIPQTHFPYKISN